MTIVLCMSHFTNNICKVICLFDLVIYSILKTHLNTHLSNNLISYSFLFSLLAFEKIQNGTVFNA